MKWLMPIVKKPLSIPIRIKSAFSDGHSERLWTDWLYTDPLGEGSVGLVKELFYIGDPANNRDVNHSLW